MGELMNEGENAGKFGSLKSLRVWKVWNDECWSFGILAYWNIRKLECWKDWKFEMVE